MKEHLETYNRQDLDAFMNTMSEDIQIHLILSKQTIKGKEDVRKLYEGVFPQYRGVEVDFTEKIISGKFVVVEETIVKAQDKNLIGAKFIVVNEIADAKIKQFWSFQ